MTQSELWREILNQFSEGIDIATFRRPNSINSRLAAWNPKENSWRWHRSFLLLAANNLSQSQIETYSKFGNVNIGSPIDITFPISNASTPSISINIDYLLALYELDFLDEFLFLNKNPRNIFEIGAGFGRTCHAILETVAGVENYTVIDLPQMLRISKEYLSLVLDIDLFEKITFLDCTQLDFDASNFDLGIQIDALQEMEISTIDYYMSNFFSKCTYFFSSNPIGKYLPAYAGIDNVDDKLLKTVTSLGLSRQVIDIWNEFELSGIRKSHVENYSPKSSEIISTRPNPLFPHFEMTLYLNSDV